VTLEFLSPGPDAVARSPMERQALEAGARLELRDGWRVAASFDGPESERERLTQTVGLADRSQLGKIEIQAAPADLAAIIAAAGAPALDLGRATRSAGAWWCAYTRERAIVLCEPGDSAELRQTLTGAAAAVGEHVTVLDVTTAFGALTIAGPLARETFARFTALDLRPAVLPLHGFRPGSVARTPGAVLREDEDRFLMLFGAALGQYVWTVVADAAGSLGGGPVGLDALEPLDDPLAEVTPGA
jgi:heterotetrameric sarcosine oxidase gamma subunit